MRLSGLSVNVAIFDAYSGSTPLAQDIYIPCFGTGNKQAMLADLMNWSGMVGRGDLIDMQDNLTDD